MKKLLVGSAAIALGLAVAAPAHAQLQLGVAGHFKGYVDWENQDTNSIAGGVRERHFDIIRDTEIHFTGETTLDNGLTVGVHVEAMADAGDSFAVDESYAYMSGYWGRVNAGDEDGAAFLLQVAAPSADSNVDGIRQYVNPVNYSLTNLNGRLAEIDYANDGTRHDDKLTYLSPVFEGFQVGASYTPTVTDNDGSFPTIGGTSSTTSEYAGSVSRTFGNSTKPVGAYFGSAYEGAARWEGTWNNVGLNLGGGYLRVTGENGDPSLNQWNGGINANIAAFGLGGIYTRDSGGVYESGHTNTWDIGGDWTTGPFKLGASWLNRHDEALTAAAEAAGGGVGTSPGTLADGTAYGGVTTNRYSGGVVYTFAPGMSFRGSVGLIRSDVSGAANVDATYGLLGTQINF
jgi:outer membrane protein OmpU